jgi:hypothetical protein
MEKQTLTRQELYELVWSTPLTTLAKRFSITDMGLRKICIKMNIPLPKVGHWAKVKYNYPVEKRKLPKNNSWKNEIQLKKIKEGETKFPGILSKYNELEKKIIKKEGNSLIVPEQLVNPHPFIVASKEYYTNKKIKWGTKEYDRLINDTISLEVSSDLVERALRIMDTLIKVMESRGHKFMIQDRSTILVIQGEEIKIRIREKYTRIPKPTNYSWQEYDHIPSGILIFCVHERHNRVDWLEGKVPLEKQLPRIIAKLEIKGEEMKKYRIDCEKHWAEEKERERIAELGRKRKEKEFSDVKNLFIKCKQWHEAQVLRNYLNESESFSMQNNKMTKKFKKWLEWARKKADWYDPFILRRDKYLNEDDKKKIFAKKKLNQFGTNYY